MSGSNSSGPVSADPARPLPALSPIALTVHELAAPDLADARQAASRRTAVGRVKMLLVLLACAAPVIASYFTYYVIRPEGRTNYGTLIQPTRTLPTTGFATLDGAAFAARSLKGQWLLVAVGGAACDAGCEKRLFAQRQLREMLGRDRDRLDKVWLVTDAAPVSPALRTALEATPGMVILRADRAAVAAWLAPAAGQALDDHLYVVDPMGEWMLRFPAALEPQRAKRDLARLLRASGSWDDAGR
jgi:hypothetical protein